MRKKIIIALIVAFVVLDAVVLGTVGYRLYVNATKPEKAHFHAGFQVYVDRKLQDFSDIKYMNVTPCALRKDMGESESPEDIQMDKAHLHDNIGDVVHAHVKRGTWGDLFKNIKYDVAAKGDVQGYVNGKAVNNILKYKIQPYDSVIMLVGNNKNIDQYLPTAVTKDAIVKAEKMSETCGT